MQETDRLQKKLPNQELDYVKIGKILLSRWYWIAASVTISWIISYTYLWYTPKTYATAGTMKFEEKKSEISDLIANGLGTSEKGPSKIQSETSVLQSRNVLISAIKDLDYRISFYIGGRIRTSDNYPQKPLDIEFLKFDSLNFYHDLISFQQTGNDSFKLTYPAGGKELEKNCTYNTPVTIGPTSFAIKKSGGLIKNAVYIFKFNSPDDFLGRIRSGLHTNELMKNSNIISIQETDSNPQFAADILNAIMVEYLNYDRVQRMQCAVKMGLQTCRSGAVSRFKQQSLF